MTKKLAFILVPAAAIVVALTAVAVFAFWTTGGGGTVSATGGSLRPVTVTAVIAGDAPASRLLPGGSADVILRVDNQNTFAVTLTNATFSGSPSVTGGSGCTSANAGVTFATQTGLSIAVPAGSSLVHLPGAASMALSSANGCQGATFSMPVSIRVQH